MGAKIIDKPFQSE